MHALVKRMQLPLAYFLTQQCPIPTALLSTTSLGKLPEPMKYALLQALSPRPAAGDTPEAARGTHAAKSSEDRGMELDGSAQRSATTVKTSGRGQESAMLLLPEERASNTGQQIHLKSAAHARHKGTATWVEVLPAQQASPPLDPQTHWNEHLRKGVGLPASPLTQLHAFDSVLSMLAASQARMAGGSASDDATIAYAALASASRMQYTAPCLVGGCGVAHPDCCRSMSSAHAWTGSQKQRLSAQHMALLYRSGQKNIIGHSVNALRQRIPAMLWEVSRVAEAAVYVNPSSTAVLPNTAAQPLEAFIERGSSASWQAWLAGAGVRADHVTEFPPDTLWEPMVCQSGQVPGYRPGFCNVGLVVDTCPPGDEALAVVPGHAVLHAAGRTALIARLAALRIVCAYCVPGLATQAERRIWGPFVCQLLRTFCLPPALRLAQANADALEAQRLLAGAACGLH